MPSTFHLDHLLVVIQQSDGCCAQLKSCQSYLLFARTVWLWPANGGSAKGQSFAHITIGLAGLVICNLSPTMSCQWESVGSGLWCSSDLVPILCPLSRAILPGQPSHATFASAPFAVHKLWAMSSIVCLIALISLTSGPNFLAQMLRGACVCLYGTMTRSLSAIASLPCCTRLRHKHNPVLTSQAG